MIRVSLSDNTIHSLSPDFVALSESFKIGETFHLHTGKVVFNKIKEFGDFTIFADSKRKKILANPTTIVDNAEEHAWYTKFFELDNADLIELTQRAFQLKIKTLVDLCCYQTATIIAKTSIEDICKVFNVENDFSPEEYEKIKLDNLHLAD